MVTLAPNSSPSGPSVEGVAITPSRMLVFAPDSESQVFLADSECETENERCFTCGPDVVRLPRSAAIAVRTVHHAAGTVAGPAAERALWDAVSAASRRTRPSASPRSANTPVDRQVPMQREPVSRPDGLPAGSSELCRQLSGALQRGDGRTAHAFAMVLQDALGLGGVYDLVRLTLADVDDAATHGKATILAEHAATSAATTVVDLLRAGAPAPKQRTTGTVVLTSPEEDRHVLALSVLGHLLEQAGHRVLIVAEVPQAELLTLASSPDTAAVVVSVHNAISAEAIQSLVGALRSANPTMKIAVGGPGMPSTRACDADLVSSDPRELMDLLAGGEISPLTPRESEVLLAVADGLTNAEIAAALFIGTATVKSHVDSVLAKTGTEHRAAAVARALRAGWIR